MPRHDSPSIPNAGSEPTRASPIAPDPLAGIRDGILRGFAHALSNRVAALSGVAGLLDFGDLPASRVSRALGSEVGQLGQLVELLRLLPSDARPRGEAVELQSTLPLVVALHAMHADLRDVACTVRHDREASPVHLRQSAFVHAMLVLIDAAKRDAMSGSGSVTVSYGGDAAHVVVIVESDRAVGASPVDADPGALGQRVVATVALIDSTLSVGAASRDGPAHGVRLELRLTTLAEVRRREREGTAER